MKKLILLISITLVSWSSFSQKDTLKDSIVPLKIPIAKLVIKDLIKSDGLENELESTKKLLSLTKSKVILKDSVITSLNIKISNLDKVINKKDRQFITQQELSTSLEKELKKQKTTTFFYKLLSGAGVILSIIFLTK